MWKARAPPCPVTATPPDTMYLGEEPLRINSELGEMLTAPLPVGPWRELRRAVTWTCVCTQLFMEGRLLNILRGKRRR